VRSVRVRGVFFRRNPFRLVGREAVKATEGVVIDLPNLESDSIELKDIFAHTARLGVFVSGRARVKIENFRIGESSQGNLCGEGCELELNGELLPPTAMDFLTKE